MFVQGLLASKRINAAMNYMKNYPDSIPADSLLALFQTAINTALRGYTGDGIPLSWQDGTPYSLQAHASATDHWQFREDQTGTRHGVIGAKIVPCMVGQGQGPLFIASQGSGSTSYRLPRTALHSGFRSTLPTSTGALSLLSRDLPVDGSTLNCKSCWSEAAPP